jgi:hypothetical protein
MCEPCDTPWPCDPARVELREKFAADPTGLSTYLAHQMTPAAREAAMLPAELYERFIEWALPWRGGEDAPEAR